MKPLIHLLVGIACIAGMIVLWTMTPWWVALLSTVVLGPVSILALVTAPLADWTWPL